MHPPCPAILYNPVVAVSELDTLVFFVTSYRNSKCRTWFYWEELNQSNDLEMAEIEATRHDGCFCTHVCFIRASLKASAKPMILNVPRTYLNQRESRDQIDARTSVTNRT